MEKTAIVRKNQNFFYTDTANFIQELGLIHFLIEKFDQKETAVAEFGEEMVFLKIFHKLDEESLLKIATTNRLQLIMKMWRSIGGKFDEKCQFEFNGISYAFEIKGYQLAPGFVLTPSEIEQIKKFAGDEPMAIIAELTISPAES
jgi:hypothetical protein